MPLVPSRSAVLPDPYRYLVEQPNTFEIVQPNCEKGFRAGLVALLQCHFRTLYLCSNAQKRNLIKIGCVECRLWYVEAGKGKSFKAQWNFQTLHV